MLNAVLDAFQTRMHQLCYINPEVKKIKKLFFHLIVSLLCCFQKCL